MAQHFELLEKHQYMSLTTYRKDGSPKATPVWFYDENDKLFVLTQATSYKVKRIRNNTDVVVAPCDARGKILSDEIATGYATLIEAGTERADYMNKMLAKKYGFFYWIFNLFYKFRKNQIIFIEITPVAETSQTRERMPETQAV